MRPSSLGGGRILRRTLSVCLSVCLSVRPVSGCTLFTVAPSYERTSKIEKLRFSLMGQRHVSLCTFRHAQRAAYRTAISAAQILVLYAYLAGHPFITDTVLHNWKTDNDRQILNKQKTAAEIDRLTNQHKKRKKRKKTRKSNGVTTTSESHAQTQIVNSLYLEYYVPCFLLRSTPYNGCTLSCCTSYFALAVARFLLLFFFVLFHQCMAGCQRGLSLSMLATHGYNNIITCIWSKCHILHMHVIILL